MGHPPNRIGLRWFIAAVGGAQMMSAPAGGSELSKAAQSLGPGQSVRLQTNLTRSILDPGSGDVLQWSSSGAWDSVRREVRFIGKGAEFRFHQLTYDEASNQWALDRPDRMPPDLGDRFGHGYDHTTVNPTNGDSYFRPFDDKRIRRWDGSTWSALPPLEGQTQSLGSISWFPGLGLTYVDNLQLSIQTGSGWTTLADPADTGIHAVSEFNPASNTLIYGGGNVGTRMARLNADKTVTDIATPPFNLGAQANEGSVLVSDPSGPFFIAWKKLSSLWTQYDVGKDRWSPLTVNSTSGDAPADGTPPLWSKGDGDSTIGISLSTYGVIMFVQKADAHNRPSVWLYRHSAGR